MIFPSVVSIATPKVKGFECGIQIENYNDIKEGDMIEVYIMEEIKR